MPAMIDWKFLMFSAFAATGLAYCLWKTHADWQQGGFGWRVVFGTAASLSAFFSVAFLLAARVLRDL
jgi:hypothetical protein